MKFTVHRPSLLSALSTAESASAKKSPQPDLQTVVLSQLNGAMSFTGTDTVVSARCLVNGKLTGKDDKSVAVDAGDFLDRVRAITADEVLLEVKEGDLIISGAKRRFKLSGRPAEQCPASNIAAIPNRDPDVRISGMKLAMILSTSAHAVSSGDVGQPFTIGMNFVWSPTTIEIMATDGHRAVRDVTDHACLTSGTALLPLRCVTELRKLADSTAGEVWLWFDDARMYASTAEGEVSIVGQLLKAMFPDMVHMLPAKSATPLEIESKVLSGAVKAVALSAAKIEGAASVKLTASKGQLAIEAIGKGEAKDELESQYEGPEWSVNLNTKYIEDALKAANSDRILISVGGAWDPVRFDPGEAQVGRSLVEIIMPAQK